MTSKRACVTCQHCTHSFFNRAPSRWYCRRAATTCTIARTTGTLCGYDGKLWARGRPYPSRLDRWLARLYGCSIPETTDVSHDPNR